MVSPKKIATELDEFWSPKIIATVDDSYVKVAKVEGSFGWHSHRDEDEMFLVLRGSLVIQLEDKNVRLAEGDLYVVPKGVRHNPVADQECHILLFEKKSTLHTGEETTSRTKSLKQQLGEE